MLCGTLHLTLYFTLYAITISPELCAHIFQVINNNGSAEFLVSTNQTFTVTPEFIGSRLLLKMKKMAERHLGVPIQRAVISVPAEFDERQRNYTIRAANLAGQYINCLITCDVNKGTLLSDIAKSKMKMITGLLSDVIDWTPHYADNTVNLELGGMA